MEADLAAIIRSGQPLSDAHFQSFIYQLLCGMKYIHSANVLHRDLKPGNLLVNADCELKICDFGLARGFSVDPDENAGYMTEYVATRWYRAPEIMLSFQSYTKASTCIQFLRLLAAFTSCLFCYVLVEYTPTNCFSRITVDVWSVGCILAELLGGRPFFKGRDYVDQLNQILHILGTPNEETLLRIGSARAQEYVRNLPYMAKKSFQSIFPNANPDALDLLDQMLAFDPSSRISVEKALQHSYLKVWHDETDEPNCPTTFNFDFEVVEDVSEMRKMILDEVYRFRQQVRTVPAARGLGAAGQQAFTGQVPIPSGEQQQWTSEDPRPQEYGGQTGELESDLQAGLDRR
jgi:mitogen-activated protein kinase 7